MARSEIYKEMEEMFGVVPKVLKELPDSLLEAEWSLMKQGESSAVIPGKYRELIALAVAAATVSGHLKPAT